MKNWFIPFIISFDKEKISLYNDLYNKGVSGCIVECVVKN